MLMERLTIITELGLGNTRSFYHQFNNWYNQIIKMVSIVRILGPLLWNRRIEMWIWLYNNEQQEKTKLIDKKILFSFCNVYCYNNKYMFSLSSCSIDFQINIWINSISNLKPSSCSLFVYFHSLFWPMWTQLNLHLLSWLPLLWGQTINSSPGLYIYNNRSQQTWNQQAWKKLSKMMPFSTRNLREQNRSIENILSLNSEIWSEEGILIKMILGWKERI